MNTIKNKTYDEERALYGIHNTGVTDCRFDGPADGESALKECADITVSGCYFNLRYPFWHDKNCTIESVEMTENCRAALWYCDNVSIRGSRLNGIKALRECVNVALEGCSVNSSEFLWKCKAITVKDTDIESEYPFFLCENVKIEGLRMKAKYSFQYVENMTINASVLDTKDAFWHSKNVTVTDSVIRGEYLGWYSENLTLIRCKITGTQPLCYCKGLRLIDCEMENADLSFERSEVDAVLKGGIDSVKNPLRGKITADTIGEIILEETYIDPADTEIVLRK